MTIHRIRPEWIAWAKNHLELAKEGAYFVYPLRGAVFQVSHVKKTLTVLCEHPDWHNSETEEINTQVFAKVGYTVIRPDDVPTEWEKAVEILTKPGLSYVDESVWKGLREMYNIPDAAMREVLRKVSRNFQGINPVTFTGKTVEHNLPRYLSVGRLGIGTDNLADAAHKFNPKEKRINWEKTMQFVIWDRPESPLLFLVGNEDDFLPAIRRFLVQKDAIVQVQGPSFRTGSDKRTFVLRRRDGEVLATIYDGPDYSANQYSLAIDYEHFARGLNHLFPHGELIVAENN